MTILLVYNSFIRDKQEVFTDMDCVVQIWQHKSECYFIFLYLNFDQIKRSIESECKNEDSAPILFDWSRKWVV